MRAAVFHGPRDVRFEEVTQPRPGEGEVLLRVKACGICGSDLHTYRHGMLEGLGTLIDSGRILGHEFSGIVAEINGAIPGLKVGDRVIGNGIGANAEFIKIPAAMSRRLIPFDDSISFIEAATTEPLATSLHAANLGEAKDTETHLIMGAGIIGLGILQCIKARSKARVLVVDLSDKRLAKAAELGADDTINAATNDAVSAVQALTGGGGRLGLINAVEGGVDVVYDCAGLGKNFKGPSVLEQALSLVKQEGKVIVVAVFEQDVTLDYNIVLRKGISIMGSWTWSNEEFVDASELIRSGKIDRKPLVSHTFSLEDASEAYETQLRAEEAVKVVFTP